MVVRVFFLSFSFACVEKLGMCGKFMFLLASCKLGVFAIYFSNIYLRTFLEASCH